MYFLCDEADLILAEPGLMPHCRAVATERILPGLTISGAEVTGALIDWDAVAVFEGQLAYVASRPATGIVLDKTASGFRCIRPNRMVRAMERPLPVESEGQDGLGDGVGVEIGLYSFPQILSASSEVLVGLGLDKIGPPEQYDIERLRRPAILRALSMIFRSMSAMDRTINVAVGVTDVPFTYNTAYRRLAEWYDLAFDREMRRLRVWVDRDANGVPDSTVDTSAPRVRRE